MSYLAVLPLARVKDYLKIDAGQTETDSEIESMIASSLSFIEKRTGHLMFARNVDYFGQTGVKVYDHPVNSVISTYVPISLKYSLYTVYNGIQNNILTLNIGYVTPNLIPNELLDAALQIIKVWFYESEKQENTTLIPNSVLQAIDVNRRFI